MGPILPAGIAANTASSGAARIGTSTMPSQPEGVASGMSAQRTAAPSDPFRVSRVSGAVMQLLQGLGGGLENDKVLQMLIALLILLALMEDSQNVGGSGGDNLLNQGSRAGGPGSWFVMTASSTTISIEQTSIYLIGMPAAQAFDAIEPTPTPGGQIDLSA